MSNSILDVIIVGGGPAGCATVLSLSRYNKGASCIILDDTDPSTFKIGESLPPESSRLLQHLHPTLPGRVQNEVASGTHLVCTGNASAWVSSDLQERHSIMNPFGHGLHLGRAAFDEMLRSTVNNNSDHDTTKSFRVVKGRFKGIKKDSACNWVIEADVAGETTTFIARWVIDATGRKASLAKKLGAYIITPDPLLAFYAVFEGPSSTDSPHTDTDHRTTIEATSSGWFYSALLSLSPRTRIVAFHTLPTHPSAKHARRREGFLDLLHASSSHISTIIATNNYEIAPGGFPRCTAAGSSYIDKPCRSEDRWFAVGDAAMAFDPLSSQGIMTALEMGYYIGMVLAGLVRGDHQEGDVNSQVGDLYRRVREEYEQHRTYYYGLVERFHDESFWNTVVNHLQE